MYRNSETGTQRLFIRVPNMPKAPIPIAAMVRFPIAIYNGSIDVLEDLGSYRITWGLSFCFIFLLTLNIIYCVSGYDQNV